MQVQTVRNSDVTSADYLRAATRFYQSNGGWFYATREGEHGPFADRQAADTPGCRPTSKPHDRSGKAEERLRPGKPVPAPWGTGRRREVVGAAGFEPATSAV